jgi:DNA-directed RNA polymerase specialized sigma24 family protein
MSRRRQKDSGDDVIAQLAPLRRYARALTRDETKAEDLVHDALANPAFRSAEPLAQFRILTDQQGHRIKVRCDQDTRASTAA